MNISKRDRNLLVFLAIILLFAAYYFLLMVPTETKIADAEVELEAKRAEKEAIEIKLMAEKSSEQKIKDLDKKIGELADQYYGNLTQEEMLMQVAAFKENLDMDFSGLKLLDYPTEDGAIEYKADVAFSTDYRSLLYYLTNVKMHDKNISVSSLKLDSDPEEGLSGNMVLGFNAIPLMSEYMEPVTPLVTYDDSESLKNFFDGPFVPYEGFKVVEEEPEVFEPEVEEVYEVDYEDYRPKTMIYSFEDGSSFFVGNKPEIIGTLTRSRNQIVGGYSADLTFDFIRARDYSEANIVFDQTLVMLNKQAEYIGMWVYAYEASDHAIGVVIKDAKGKEYKVEIASQVDWTQWEEIETELPVEISYPCKIERIYIEGIGYEQKVTGRYLIDKLQVSYPID